MKTISKNDLCAARTYDKNLANMKKESMENYLQIYALYSSLFTEYLMNMLDLGTFDKLIKNSELNFKPVNEKDMDIYQYLASDFMTFFYPRNNLYIERMNKDEISFFMKKLTEGKCDFDEESQNMINKTYKKVTYEGDKTQEDQSSQMAFFGPTASTFMADVNSIVIGFRYDEFSSDGVTDEEWNQRNNKQLIFLDNVISQIVAKSHEKRYVTIDSNKI